ncbi:S-4TM family putative pore-forming effector [Streptomyces sp. NPDC006356]
MPSRTNPSITEAQNQERSIRLLSAQRRMYADAKVIYNLRLSVIMSGGIIGATCALIFTQARPVIGAATGVILLSLSIAGAATEKSKVKDAAAVQEEFDTSIFQLPWNQSKTQRVSPSEVARASLRHKGSGLTNWYADTEEAPRPLDVLMCQRSNLGWGISMHRSWAMAAMSSALAVLIIAAIPCLLMHLSFSAALFGVYAPLIAVTKELLEIWRSNLESAIRKELAEGRAIHLLTNSLETGEIPTESDCRELQDEILESRQTNAMIPDWYYRIRRDKDEKAMHLSVMDYIEQAKNKGHW